MVRKKTIHATANVLYVRGTLSCKQTLQAGTEIRLHVARDLSDLDGGFVVRARDAIWSEHWLRRVRDLE